MKLFVVIRKDLSPSQRIVQAGHAIAEYMMDDPKWRNTTLVCLGSKNLDLLKYKLDMHDIRFVEFREPNLGNITTALASDVDCEFFRKLNLI